MGHGFIFWVDLKEEGNEIHPIGAATGTMLALSPFVAESLS